MRFRQFQLARISGIPVIIDYSWLPVVALHVWLVSQFYLPYRIPLAPALYITLGAVMTALLFASVLIHELSHAVMARLEGIRIHDIQLHIFGGWARLVGEPRTPMAELRIAAAGPAASFILTLVFLAGFLVMQQVPGRPLWAYAALEVFLYLSWSNLVLAMFNLLPGLPLDGGRVLRAALWHRKGDILAATLTAKRCGVAIAYMLSSYGIFWAFWTRGRDLLTAVWMLLIGFFLKNAAESDYRHRERERAGEQAGARRREQWGAAGTVGAVMTAPAVSVPPELGVGEFVDRILTCHRYPSFPVARDGRLHGILSLARMRELLGETPREEWERLAVRDVMEPVSDSLFVPVRASVEHAARKLEANQLGHLAVVDGEGLLVGYLSADDLGRAA